MKSKPFMLIGAFAFLLVFDQVSAHAVEFGVRANYWFPAFTSTLQVDKDGIIGTKVDLKEDLNAKSDNIPFVEAYLGAGNHELTLMYAYINGSGENTIVKDIVFDGNVYHSSAFVESRLRAHVLDLEYQYKLLNFKNILAGLSLGVLLRVKYIDAEASLFSPTAGSNYDIKENLRLPVPMVGAAARVGILANILEARVKGVGMGYSGNYIYDAMADLAVTPFPFVDIHGGYRIMAFKVDGVSDIFADMMFHGPYVGVKVGF
jgi:hypothetical protein